MTDSPAASPAGGAGRRHRLRDQVQQPRLLGPRDREEGREGLSARAVESFRGRLIYFISDSSCKTYQAAYLNGSTARG
jgi:hypothetical protein